MRHLFLLISLATLIPSLLPAQLYGHWESRSPMPVRRTNIAAASLEIGDTTFIYTFMGLDSTKQCGNNVLDARKYNTVSDTWSAIAPVPDTEGRIAASATGLNGKIYLIGGYKVFPNCTEFTSPRVDIYDPLTDTWSLGDSIPVPTDDHVQFLWQDSLIYCISGWSQTGNIRNVQIYDTYLDSWTQANLIQGTGLFGHSGSLSGDSAFVYIDGVSNSFILQNTSWLGRIGNGNPNSVSWTNLGAHGGKRVYRGGSFSFGARIIFTGGTSNAYNINGIGYNGQPSTPSGRTFGYNLQSQQWEDYARNPDSVMDVRDIVQVGSNQFYVIGGMEAGQVVSRKVSVFVVDSVATSRTSYPTLGTTVWPNPVRESFRISSSGLPLQAWSLRDLQGKLLRSGQFSAFTQKVEIRTGDLPEGLYLLEISLMSGQNAQHLLRLVR